MSLIAKKISVLANEIEHKESKPRDQMMSVRSRTASDYAALIIATCAGIGYIPVIPATWGSLFGAVVFFIFKSENRFFKTFNSASGLSEAQSAALINTIGLILLVGLFLIGIWAAERVEKITDTKDAKVIVIDELVGISLMFYLLSGNLNPLMIFAGFILFRLFDILKPYPINKLESLPGGLGVMADDILAGVYAAACLSIIVTIIAFL